MDRMTAVADTAGLGHETGARMTLPLHVEEERPSHKSASESRFTTASFASRPRCIDGGGTKLAEANVTESEIEPTQMNTSSIHFVPLGSVKVMTLDLRSTDREFDFPPPHCRVATRGKSFNHLCPAALKLRPYGVTEV